MAGERLGDAPLEAFPVIDQVAPGGQGVFPFVFELACDQAVFWFGEAVGAPSPIHLVLDAFQALLPDFPHGRPGGRGLLHNLEVDLDRVGSEDGQDLLGDEGIQAAADDMAWRGRILFVWRCRPVLYVSVLHGPNC